MQGPLKGVKIIDLTTIVMGPYATQILGDMGAEVIKIEVPGGDLFRYVSPSEHPTMSANYLQLNRNKKSIVLNLKDPAEQQILQTLLQDADVLISNIRPQSLRKLGLSYEQLKESFPRLIYCGVYGFAEDGPYAGKPAYDDLIQAMSGLADLQGRNKPHYQPEYVNTIMADKVVGLSAVNAITMALYEREKSNLGQSIEIPMFETMVSFNLAEHMGEATFCRNPHPHMGYGRVLSPSRKPYRTQNGFMAILPYNTENWTRFFTLSGHAEYLQPQFLDPAERGKHIDTLYQLVEQIMLEKTTEEWLSIFQDADIPMAPVQILENLLNDPHLLATGFFEVHDHPTEGKIRMSAIATKFSRTPGQIHSVAPNLDEHGAHIKERL